MYCNIFLGSVCCKTPSIKLSQFPRVAAAPCLSVRLIQYLLPPRHQPAYMPAASSQGGLRGEETFPSAGKLAGGRAGQGHSATCHVPLWSPRFCIIKGRGKVMLGTLAGIRLCHASHGQYTVYTKFVIIQNF